jgi:hypothetical protein
MLIFFIVLGLIAGIWFFFWLLFGGGGGGGAGGNHDPGSMGTGS